MARKGGKRGSSAARSAAAKKGWETRRRGGAKAKPAARKATAPTKPKQAAGRRGMPKTTSARGRALTNQRRAADLVRASRGGKGPSAKAVRSLLTAQRARAFYDKTGGGKKRSAVKAKSAAKIGKSIRAESRAKATAARAKVAGRASSRMVVTSPRTGKPIRRAALRSSQPRFTGNGVKFRRLGLSSTIRREDRLRQSYFRSKYGTKTQAGRKAMLLRGTANRDRALSRLRQAKLASPKPAAQRPAAAKSVRLPRNSGRLRNRTGSSKQLTRYNSTQSGSGRRPLDVMGWERDAAKARLATKTDRSRSRTKERRAKQAVTDRRASRATANQARVTAALKKADGSGFRRGTRKERRSIFTAQAALSFYRSNAAVDTQRVDVHRPGFRLPRSKR